jgi:hypothetical protein
MGLRWFWVFVFCASGCGHAAGCAAAGAGAASASMRMISVKQDAVLGSRWGLMVDCAHPERPSRWMLLPAGEELSVTTKTQSVVAAVRGPMIVRAGETVRAWSQDGVASIETSGVAEQSGAAGARIQVRLTRRGLDGESVERHVSGVVDGAGSVEIR